MQLHVSPRGSTIVAFWRSVKNLVVASPEHPAPLLELRVEFTRQDMMRVTRFSDLFVTKRAVEIARDASVDANSLKGYNIGCKKE
jgi:hypothetical protein